jgi:hypothetical protein
MTTVPARTSALLIAMRLRQSGMGTYWLISFAEIARRVNVAACESPARHGEPVWLQRCREQNRTRSPKGGPERA